VARQAVDLGLLHFKSTPRAATPSMRDATHHSTTPILPRYRFPRQISVSNLGP